MKSYLAFVREYWKHLLVAVVLIVAAYAVIFQGISTLNTAYSAKEIAAQSSSTSLRAIWENPTNAPYKLLLWAPFKLGHHSVLVARVIAGVFALLAAGLFYFVANTLFSRRIALFSTILFVMSSGFLHTSHLGTPHILQIFGVLVLLALLPAYLLVRSKKTSLYVAVIALSVLLYIPGVIWFIAVGCIVLFKRLAAVLRVLSVKHKIALAIIACILVVPLVWASIVQPAIALHLLGLPVHLTDLAGISDRASALGLSLFWSGQGPAEIMLVGAPVLNIIEFGLLFIGLAVQFKRPRLRSNYFVLGTTLFVALLIIIGGVIDYTMLTPIFCLLMAAGIFYLLDQWHTVFPVNPVAHVIGTALVTILVVLSAMYHVRAFYVAWPKSEATKTVFSISQPTNYFGPDSKSTAEPSTNPVF